ncbi:DUF5949 family protein [Streptomyces sp. NPDC002867]
MRGSPIHLLVQGGRAVVTMSYMNAQCPVLAEWLAAAGRRGTVDRRPRLARGDARRALAEGVLQGFLGDEATLTAAAHVLLPVSRLRDGQWGPRRVRYARCAGLLASKADGSVRTR